MAHTSWNLLDYSNHLLYYTKLILLAIDVCAYWKQVDLSILVLNFLYPLKAVILKPLAPYRSRTVSIALVILLVVLEMRGSVVMKFTLFVFVDIKG